MHWPLVLEQISSRISALTCNRLVVSMKVFSFFLYVIFLRCFGFAVYMWEHGHANIDVGTWMCEHGHANIDVGTWMCADMDVGTWMCLCT